MMLYLAISTIFCVFVASYGRRRVGKTYLVRETLSGQFSFEISGLANANTKEQLLNFSLTLKKVNNEELNSLFN
jgi:AAA+ ATPase superfamily predicted ATPase